MPPPQLIAVRRRFGLTVRRLRLDARLSQIELAEIADLTHNFVGEVERGEKVASLETIVRLASAFRLSGADLLAKAKV